MKRVGEVDTLPALFVFYKEKLTCEKELKAL